jgi:pimeloyl-ACP methyl ester carboxylesterase
MKPFDAHRLIFIHGLEGSSLGTKAVFFRSLFPEMLTPDFKGELNERMQVLDSLLGKEEGWTIIGSSLGGLMAASFTCQHPEQVRKLILLAPALCLPEFSSKVLKPIDVPTIIYHGKQDTIVPLEETCKLAEKAFNDLMFFKVDDDHRLEKTVLELNWRELVV